MISVAIAFVIFSLFPLIAVSFRSRIIRKKEDSIFDNLRNVGAFELDFVKAMGGEQGIRAKIEKYYDPLGLTGPALLLVLSYALGFLLCKSYLTLALGGGSPTPFTKNFVMAARPFLMTFLGTYVFNLGTTVRRLYVSDLTKNIFWSGLNRLILSASLAVVISTAYKLGAAPAENVNQYFYFVFFAIPFVADVFLDHVVGMAMKAVNIKDLSVRDLSLRWVKGINIWKEFRLEEEGIENIENLATADPIDLAVRTQYPLKTIVDWVDQAMAFDRLGEKASTLRQEGLISGAIDLAWLSPTNNNGDATTAKLIADKLVIHQQFVENLMNGLNEDSNVQNLWKLWQKPV